MWKPRAVSKHVVHTDLVETELPQAGWERDREQLIHPNAGYGDDAFEDDQQA